jgi:uncharacterized protein (TIGR02118 family)
MSTCLFLSFRSRGIPCLDADAASALDAALRRTPKLTKALVHTSANADDPYVKDEAPPQLVLQLYFAEIADLEAAIGRGGHLGVLTSLNEFPELAAAEVTQQAMMVRTFAVPEPAFQNASEEPYCTYLVSYEGAAQDLNAWLHHYLDKHTGHMARFPGLRELEVYTRLDWVSVVPWPRVDFMQRNKVAFDSSEALTHALHSPVRHEMRADFTEFPTFTGPNRHHAMATRVVLP